MELKPIASLAALVQGVYYLVTGLWPIVSRSSFEKITGPKVDFWLVRSTGALIGTIGSALLLAGARRKVSRELMLLGVGSAASLGGADIIYASRGRIPPVYMLESLAEIGLIGLWLVSLLLETRTKPASVLQLPPENGPTDRA